MNRIDTGVARPGRRPQASLDFPLEIKVGNHPNQTLLLLDGEVIGMVKHASFEVTVDDRGKAHQKLTLHVYDRSDQAMSVQLVDRLHEMTDHNPLFDLDFDIIPWVKEDED